MMTTSKSLTSSVMELSPISLVLLFLISILIVVSSRQRRIRTTSRRRPSGPRALPLIGSIHHLLTSQPEVALRDLATKHGPVMYLRLGEVDNVVISSAAAAQEVLHAKDLSFASRPSLLVTEIIAYNNLDVGFAPYGPYWRALRKLCTLELLSARKVRQLAPIRDAEVMSLVRKIRDSAGDGEPVNLSRLLLSCANQITSVATFGDRCGDERRERFLSSMAVMLSYGSGFCISDLFPSLWFVDTLIGTRRRLRRVHRQVDRLLDEIITECEVRRKERKMANAASEEDCRQQQGEGDLLSIMLRIRDEGELDFPIDTTNIKAVIMDLFTAGTETTSTAAEWVMTELIRNPEIMAKVQAEIRQAFNNKDPHEHESQMDNLRYTRMVIKETLRLHPPVPILLPRLCRETCDVGGFEIVKGTRVIVNSWAMSRSTEYWEDPEEFRPERFENSVIDYRGAHYEYLPFGSGRRMCPGSGFGVATLESIVVRLLYYFDWSLPSGMRPEELDMRTAVGASARRKIELQLVASPYEVPLRT